MDKDKFLIVHGKDVANGIILKQGKMYHQNFSYRDKLEVKWGYMVNVSVARWPMERGQFGSEFVVAGCESLIPNTQ